MSDTGPIRDLDRLLASMEPVLAKSLAGFTSASSLIEALSRWGDDAIIGTFREEEGLTVILDLSHPASHGFETDFRTAWITLTVHSDLQAVGLTAAFATALGQAGISCNVVAALHHDHIFVLEACGQQAMDALNTLQRDAVAKS